MSKNKTVNLTIDGETRQVLKRDYIRAKTRDLKEYGYASLTEKDVEEQLEKVLANEELTVIGMFIQKDILKK